MLHHINSFLSHIFIIILTWLFIFFFFFLNDPAPTDISPLPLHDPLPISSTTASAITTSYTGRTPLEHGLTGWFTYFGAAGCVASPLQFRSRGENLPLQQRGEQAGEPVDRKSTRLNSSHSQISYAVFCLKK